MFPDTLITHFGIDSMVLVQGIVVVDAGGLVAALLIDAAVLGVVVSYLAKFFYEEVRVISRINPYL